MSISERTLKKWRKNALEFIDDTKDMKEAEPMIDVCKTVLQMTQVLLDQHLLNKGK